MKRFFLVHVFVLAVLAFLVPQTAHAEYTTTIGITSCQGDSLLINGQYVVCPTGSQSSVYTVTYKAVDGTDSIVQYIVNFLPSFHFVEKRYLVLGESFLWHGQTVDGSQSTYYDRNRSVGGCDSTYELHVSVIKEKPVLRSSETISICQSALPYRWQGELRTAAGYYYKVFTTASGEDSIAELNLIVTEPVYCMEQFTICRGSEFVTSTGRTIREPGVYRDTLRASSGCDSIHILVVNYANSYTRTDYRTVNEGEEFEWMGNTYRLYRDETLIHRDNTSIYDCDSIRQLVVSVIHKSPKGYFLQEVGQTCEGESFAWRGRDLREAGTYFDSLRTYDGTKDSVFSLRLTVWPKQQVARQITVCDGAKLVVNGRSYRDVDIIVDTLQTIHGCDSIVHTYINRTRAYHYYDTIYLTNQQTYDWHGQHITTSGTYYDDHKSVDGCDSTYQLEVRLAQTYLKEEQVTICHGETPYVWPVNKRSYYSSGTYEEIYTSRQGTDSICRLRLTVLPEYKGVQQLYICEGSSVEFNGVTYDKAGTYTTTLKTQGGCDSTVTVYVNMAPTYRFHQTEVLAKSELPYQWQNQTITKSGTYHADYKTSFGCDSTYDLMVVVDPDYVTTVDTTVCASALPYTWRGKEFNASGSYEDVMKSVKGRDSIFILNLTVRKTVRTIEEAYICHGSSVTVNGVTYREPGVYSNTYTTQSGCDSIHEVIIRMNQNYHYYDTIVISDRQLPYLWHGQKLTEGGTYTDNQKTVMGCDSVYTLVLRIRSTFLKEENVTICESDLPYLWRGRECREQKLYEDVYRTAEGYDSIYRLKLTILPVNRDVQHLTICKGGHVNIGGTDYYEAAIVQDSVPNETGCPSVITYIINTVNPVHTYDTLRICDQQLPYTWRGQVIRSAGTYVDRSTAGNGCDSIGELCVLVYPTYHFKEEKTICQEEVPYEWHGQVLRGTGVYYDHQRTTQGFDSIYELSLTVGQVYRRTEQLYLCDGQSLVLNGKEYHDSQIVTQELKSHDGCDSVITYVINRLSSYHIYDTLRLATTQLPYQWHGLEITSAGSYRNQLQTRFGCDSTEEVYVEVYPTYYIKEDSVICARDAEHFSWHGQELHTSGIYYDRLHTVAGFDSIYELSLTILPNYEQTVMVDLCYGDDYVINGRSYSSGGTVVDTMISTTGCDSVVTYIINQHPNYNRYDTVQLCDQQLPYNWYDQQITKSGNYFHSLETEAGCQATHQLTVTVYPTYRVTKDTAICASEVPYIWMGQTFYESSQQTVNLKTVAGYDSTLILNLTVYPNYESTQRVDICQGSEWQLNGRTYMESGIYTDTLISATGCDSVIHYVLNVQPIFHHRDTIVARSGETVNWHGQEIRVAGTYTAKYQTRYGCDSVYEAYVIFQNAYLLVKDTALCESELPYFWRGHNYFESGTYSEALKTQQGTDSVYRLNLTVWPAPRADRHYTLCPGGSITYKGQVFSRDTILTDTLHTAAGCDSILRIIVTEAQTFKRSDTLHISDQDLKRQWRGQTLDHAGTYQEHFLSVEGCDSTYELVVYIHPTYHFVTDTMLCQADAPYHWRGRDYNMIGTNTYTESYRTTMGYDSIYELRLTIYPEYRHHRNLSFCEGDSVRIGSRWYHEEMTIYDTTLSRTGCDSVEIYHLHMNHKFYAEESHNLNDGETFLWIRDGKTYGTPGVYWYYGKSVAGCDSIYRLNLTRNPSYHFVEERNICLTTDSTAYWHGQALTETRIYWDSLQTAAGQDSIYELRVHAWPTYRYTQQLNICEGGSITFQGRTYTTDGEWVDTLSTVHGCDSIITIKVNVTPRFFSSDTVRFSNKETYEWHGQTIRLSGTYYDYNTSKINGCDSTYELVAIVYPTYLFQTDTAVCQSEVPFMWRGQEVGTMGSKTYEEAYHTVNGYDSIYRLNLTVFPEKMVRQKIQICQGETTTFNGRVYAYSGTYYDTIQTVEGCDSVIIMDVNVSRKFYQEQHVYLNDGEKYFWPVDGKTYGTVGTYIWNGKTVAGCDSIYKLFVHRNPSYHFISDTTVCQTEVPFMWRGRPYTKSGTYYDSLHTVAGQDSIYQLNLVYHPMYRVNQAITLCQGETQWFRGKKYTESGTYADTLTSMYGCDSILTVSVIVTPTFHVTDTITLCSNEAYPDTLWHDQRIDRAGMFYDKHQTINGCDSIYELLVIRNPEFRHQEDIVICQSEAPYIWGVDSTAYSELGTHTYERRFQTVDGCDSVYQLNLTINPTQETHVQLQTCRGQRVTYNGQSFAPQTQAYEMHFQTVNGCDSVVYIHVNALYGYEVNDTARINEGESYTWHDSVYTQQGVYAIYEKTAQGCDSIMRLFLFVHKPVRIDTTDEFCSSDTVKFYAWRGQRLWRSGVYYDSIWHKDSSVVDTIYSLDLTFHNYSVVDTTVDVCKGMTYTFNDQTITKSGDYVWKGLTSYGCDSIIRLHVNFNQVQIERYDTICDGNSLVRFDSTIWDEGFYKFALPNEKKNGCDTIFMDHVIVKLNFNRDFADTICEDELINDQPYLFRYSADSVNHPRYLWGQWNDSTGHWEDSTYASCDSSHFFTLHIVQRPIKDSIIYLCEGDSAWVPVHNGEYRWVKEAGYYDDTIPSPREVLNHGCDSIFRVRVFVLPQSVDTITKHVSDKLLPYKWHISDSIYTLTEAGYYSHTDSMVHGGCDSITVLHLIVDTTYFFEDSITICKPVYYGPGDERNTAYYWEGHKALGLSDYPIYNEGTYWDSLRTKVTNVDSVYKLVVHFYPTKTTRLTYNLCEGDSMRFRDGWITHAGTYIDTLYSGDVKDAQFKCDSIVIWTVNMIHSYFTPKSVTISDEQSYHWSLVDSEGDHSRDLDATGVYRDTLKTVDGCDSIMELRLTVLPTYHFYEKNTICESQLPYSWTGHHDNKLIYKEGTYYDRYLTSAGYDSIYQIDLEVLPSYTMREVYTTCAGDSLHYLNKDYTAPGIYRDTLQSSQFCDSIIVIDYQWLDKFYIRKSAETQANHPYRWIEGDIVKVLDHSGVYYDTLSSVRTGCDSIIELTLTVWPNYEFRQDTTVCEQDLPFIWHGRTLNGVVNEMVTYHDSLQALGRADSVYILNLTVKPTPRAERFVALCSGDYYVFHGERYYKPVMLHDTIASLNGCDSLLTINVTFYQTDTIRQSAWTKDYTPYIWHPGERTYTLTQPGIYRDTVKYKVQEQNLHCDSLIYELDLKVYKTYYEDSTATVCESELPFKWHNYHFMKSTEFSDTIRHDVGSDSIYTLHLTVLDTAHSSKTVKLCAGDYYEFHGQKYTKPVVLQDTLRRENGCDSIVTINVDFYQVDVRRETHWTKDYIPYIWRPGNRTYTLTQPGLYRDTVKYTTQPDYMHCDSVIYELDLKVYKTYYKDTIVGICESELPFQWHGYNFMDSVEFSDTIRHDQGCDSIYNLSLTVWPVAHETKTFTLCQGEVLDYNGQHYFKQGQYQDTLSTVNGCDSIITINLRFHPKYFYQESATTNDKNPYFWHGKAYTQSGIYYDSLQSVYGCDSTYELNLTVYTSYGFDTLATVCASELPFFWHGRAFNETCVYSDTLQTINHTDSICTLHLTVLDTSMTHYNMVICQGDYRMYNGSRYDHQGIFLDTLTNRNGCDSIVAIHVQVMPKYESHEYQRTMDLPYQWHGRSYSKPGVYYDSLTSVSGCDSVYVLHLQIYSISDLYIRLCDGETLHYNGHDYPQPGYYRDTIHAANGCDSIVNIHFTQVKAQYYHDSATICSNETYGWTDAHGKNRTLKFAGTYRDTIRAAGTLCDSLVYEFQLNVLPTSHHDTTIVMCRDEGSLRFGTRDYSETGTYVDTMQASNGCDSIWTIHLTVHDWQVIHIDTTLCENDIFIIHGDTVTEDARYTDTIQVSGPGQWGTAHSCGTIIDYNIKYQRAQHIHFSATTPADQPYTWRYNGKNRVVQYTGDYTDTARFVRSQCDSVVWHLHLKTYPVYSRTIDTTVCSNDLPFMWNNLSYSTDQTIHDTVRTDTANYYTTITLHIQQAYYAEQVIDLCEGSDFVFRGKSYNTQGNYYDTIPSVHGCDSITKIIVRVHPTYDKTDTVHISDQQTYDWHGRTLEKPGKYEMTAQTASGCDSILHLILVVHPSYHKHDTLNQCSGDTLLWHDQEIVRSGDYKDPHLTTYGFDSIYYLHVVFHEKYLFNETYTLDPTATTLVHGHDISVPGEYWDTLHTIYYCDSVYHIVVNSPRTFVQTQYATTCDGEPYWFYGQKCTRTGAYTYISPRKDTTITLHLTVFPKKLTNLYIVVTPEDDDPYFNDEDGRYYTAPSYDTTVLTHDTMKTVDACDSIICTHFTVTTHYSDWKPYYICPGSFIVIDNDTIWKPGRYTFIKTRVIDARNSRRDSLLRVEVFNAPEFEFPEEKVTVCQNELPYNYHGKLIYRAGQSEVTLKTVHECDSVYRINLTVLPSYDTILYTVVTPDYKPFYWDRTHSYYYESDTIHDRYQTVKGCDSTFSVILVVVPTIIETTNDDACSGKLPYYWKYQGRDSLVYETGFYNDTIWDMASRTSIIRTLHLTVSGPTQLDSISVDPVLCADNKTFTIDYYTSSTVPDSYSIDFEAKANQQGLEDIPNTTLGYPSGTIVVDIPQSVKPAYTDHGGTTHYRYMRPDIYKGTITFNNNSCGSSKADFEFEVMYPSWIIAQKWDNVVAPLCKDSNGGYELTNYHWLVYDKNGNLFGQSTQSYYYTGSQSVKLPAGGSVILEAKRKDDGYAIATCPLVIEEYLHTSSGAPHLSHTYIPRHKAVAQVVSAESGSYKIYTSTGDRIGEGTFSDNNRQVQFPAVSGCFIIEMTTNSGTHNTEKVLIY